MRKSAGLTLNQYKQGALAVEAIMVQYKDVQPQLPRGMHIIPDADDIFRWHGMLMVPAGLLYGGNVAVFTLDISPEFPGDGAMPTVTFSKCPRHPLVAPKTGLFALEHFIPEWKLTTPLAQVLRAIKTAFAPCRAEVTSMCHSPHVLDPRTVESMLTDLAGFVDEVASTAGPLRQSLLRTSADADRPRGPRDLPEGGFEFTAAAPQHAALMDFLRGGRRTAEDVYSFVETHAASRPAAGAAPADGPAAAPPPAADA